LSKLALGKDSDLIFELVEIIVVSIAEDWKILKSVGGLSFGREL
jgi:hypothetical protein